MEVNPRDDDALDLRARRAEQTRAEIFAAAIPLFADRGFDEVSMDDVAEASGVSRRTVYRYFETKDDIVFEPPRRWLEVFNAVVADRGEGEPTRELFRRGLVAVCRYIEEHAEEVLSAFAVLSTSESLRGRHGRSDAEWVQRYLELIGPDFAAVEHGVLLATTLATTLVAAQNALIVVWAAQPDADLLEMLELVLDRFDPHWPEASHAQP